MRRWPGERPHLQRAGTALVPCVIVGCSATSTLMAAAGISLLVLVLVIAVVALGASFSRRTARRRACLQALEALLRLAPWTDKR
jgi:hypothetical protein